MRTQVERVQISGILDDSDQDWITVEIAASRQPLRIKRSQVQFAPGAIVMPAWLWKRIFEKKLK